MLDEAIPVGPTTTRRLVGEGALLVDVRECVERTRTALDVPAIVNIPRSELEQRWSELPRDREIVRVCETGQRSLKATYYLQHHGFQRVSSMRDGLLKWMRKGFPVIGDCHEAPTVSASSCCGGAAPQKTSTGCC